jgi:hypothetical protein
VLAVQVPLTSLEAQLAGGGRGPHGRAPHG